mmetsp:Transcript_43911/g.107776  ORF Transcript_43911/g.107776 Transcript_43911/m.107776 type:complete len:342 (+) Transcript_43911:81-1106(+)
MSKGGTQSNESAAGFELRHPDDPAFDAFRRSDAPVTLGDRLRVAVLLPLIVLRVFVLVLAIVGCWFSFIVIGPPMEPKSRTADPTNLPPWRAKIVHWSGVLCAKSILLAMGFFNPLITEEEGYDAKEASKAAIVSNHVSMLDIPMVVAHNNSGFVAKASLSHIPLFARIAAVGGCIFVDRLSQGAGSVTEQVIKRQKQLESGCGHPILLFPEGTTTNGKTLMNFKTGAFVAGAPVAPILIQYPAERFSPAYDSILALDLVKGLCTQWYNRASLHRLKVYYPSAEEKADPKLYANNVRQMLLRYGKLGPTDSTYLDKLEFQSILRGTKVPRAVVEARSKKSQ